MKRLKILLWRYLGLAQGKHSERHSVYKYFMVGNVEIRVKRKVSK